MTQNDLENVLGTSLTREERIEALRRDQERMRLPDDYDRKAVVRAAMEHVRANRNQQLEFNAETARAMRRAEMELEKSGFMSDVLFGIGPICLLAILALVGFIILFLGASRSVSQVAWSETLVSFAVPGLVVAFVGVALGKLIAPRIRKASYGAAIMQNSGGALLAGMCGLLLFGFLTYKSSIDIEKQLDVALATTENQLGQYVLESYRDPRPEAVQSECKGTVGAVTLSTVPGSNSCSASMDFLPGSMVARMGESGGQLIWENGDVRQMRAQVLLGKVSQVSSEKMILKGLNGEDWPLKMAIDVQGVTRGEYVAVVTDSNAEVVTQIQPISYSGN